ncbi:MAG: asparagine synthase B [Solobacterium sp.]|nr:asparagine synthase B [Solobacterium sp.]
MCGLLVTSDPDTELEEFEKGLETLSDRGPDDVKLCNAGHGMMGFRRLAIMGLNEKGMQPFERNGNLAVCNGELYGFRKMKEELLPGYEMVSGSDCEIILPLYEKYGTKMFSLFDAEFVCVIYDREKDQLIAARDPIGIRPMYYGYTENGMICFGSTPASLMPIAGNIQPFPPGHYWEEGAFIPYETIWKPEGPFITDDIRQVCGEIHDLLVTGVKKRMDADVPVGYLLSGGLDSSLVCAIAQRESKTPIRTFAIGMEKDAIDLKYARQAAEYIGSDHTEVIITADDVLKALPEVIRALATWDITTIRASIGMYLLCRYIHENTNIRVLFTGEISDELFGYKYTDFAPDAASFQEEAEKRIREIHMYDVLRADRCISSNSLESRVPFGDLDFVRYVMRIDPEKKMNTYGMGKHLLRQAFADDPILPESIRLRDKAAFSDAVGHSLADEIKAYAERKYSDEEAVKRYQSFDYKPPYTKESLLYREIFEQYYPGMAGMIIDFWLPNQSWEGCAVSDPSARYLSNYGKSGE